MALRATFLVDADGVVAFAEVNGPGDVREQSDWKDAVGRCRLSPPARGTYSGRAGRVAQR